MIIDFISSYIVDIVIVIAFITLLIILYKRNRKEVVKEIILHLVIEAEKKLGNGTGDLKYADVINRFYKELPILIRIFFTPKDIDKYIEDGVKKLKELLEKDTDLDKYIKG